MNDRLSEVNFIQNLASNIASVQPTEVKRAHARQAVVFHLATMNLPDWFNDQDLELLIKFVEDDLP